MKILMLLDNQFPPDVRVENEMIALSEAGHEVHLASPARKDLPLKESWNKCIVHRRRMSAFIYKSSVGAQRFPFYFNFWRKFVSEILSGEKFDAVHVHDLPLSIIGIEIKKKYNTRLVIDLHENWPALLRHAAHTNTFAGKLLSSDKQWTAYEKKVLPEADLVITIVEEAKERIEALGVDRGKICIVSNTVNTDSIKLIPGKPKHDHLVLFYGGGINRHRGLQIVFEAMRLLKERQSGVKLILVGSGSYVGELKQQAERLGLDDNIDFLGFKPFNEMMSVLAEADAALIPHLRNENNDASSPNKLYQYMYLEKPVISSDCISLKRMITETDSGFIYKNDSPIELANLLEYLDLNRSVLEKKGKNGKKAVEEKYSWKYDKERLINGYEKLSLKS
jgi:glycosyltransferase involved in cell wall biosynthesis